MDGWEFIGLLARSSQQEFARAVAGGAGFVPSVAGEDYFEEANRDRGENRSPQLAYVVTSRRKIAARSLRRSRRQAERGDDSRLLRFHNGFCVQSEPPATDSDALVTANWCGCRRAFASVRRARSSIFSILRPTRADFNHHLRLGTAAVSRISQPLRPRSIIPIMAMMDVVVMVV